MTPRQSSQRGFALMSAIFLLVVLGSLGAYAVRMGSVQQHTVDLALLSARAFHAARTGVEWGAHQAVNLGLCGATTLNLTEGGTTGFRVDVNCAQTAHIEAGNAIQVYVIDVMAEFGVYGGPDYVSRRLQVKVTDES
jgi:MSHA biogenesis protein MshP